MLPEGQQLGHYSLLRLLKSGGMGEIHLAEDKRLHRQVAIKVVNTDLAYRADAEAAKEAIRLFLREAQVIAQLDHIHILPLYDSDETVINGIPLMYMVMPFRQKGSLDEWLQQQHQLSIQAIANIIEQAASALQHAHDHQIIHQDVKPANFLIRGERGGYLDLQLADFGIARLATTTGESQTIRGTPSYIAPEQWEGHPVPATDQYALAVMAYELLAGSVPFQGHQYEVMHKHLHEQPQPPSVRNPNVPVSIDAVLLRALAKNPADRFLSISAFARAFHLALYDSGDIHVTLALTPFEAQVGCRSVLVLPGERKIAVDVPANARHGQVIRFRGLGNHGYGGRLGALVLTIAIGKAEETMTLASSNTVEKTLPALPPNHAMPPGPRNTRNSRIRALPLITMALFIIMSSAGLLYFTRVDAENTAKATATATTQAKNATATTQKKNAEAIQGTATQQAHLSATASAQSQASVTAARHASETAAAATSTARTATAVAQTQTATAISATASVIVESTVQANLSVTAIAATYDKLFTEGSPQIDDSLKDNYMGYQWDDAPPDGSGGCFFKGGYHTSAMQPATSTSCFAKQPPDYTDFSYQVGMSIVTGNQGGIAFRADPTQGTFYGFSIDSNGMYNLSIYSNFKQKETLTTGASNAIQTGPNAVNLVAVYAKGGIISLYINKQLVDSVQDTTYTQGKLGVIAIDTTDPTEAVFSNMKVRSL